MRRNILLLILATLLISLLSFWTLQCSRHFPAAAPPNILLITIDTLRADRLGCYGYRGGKTQNIDQLAADGAIFLDASAQAPLTLPSHCSIMTGTLPLHHGVKDNAGFELAEEHETIAETLRRNGYATAAVVGAFVLDKGTGIGQGFDYFYDKFIPEPNKLGKRLFNINFAERRASEVATRALEWLARRPRRRPFFLWLHFYDPHEGYNPPEPFARLWRGREYDGEIAYVDSQLGRILSFLRETGLYDRTVIALTSDHGESLGEHGEKTHGYFIYESVLRVPFILKPVEARQLRLKVSEPVRTIDIFPTLLQAANIPRPESIQGVGLLGLVMEKENPDRLPIYAESLIPFIRYSYSPLYSLRLGRYKYIDAPRPELYDLEADPTESSNLAACRTALAGSLREQLNAFKSAYARHGVAPRPRGLNSETIEKLKSLGYIGYTAPGPTQRSAAALADPKDMIAVHELVQRILATTQRDDPLNALLLVERLLKLDGRLALGYSLLGSIYASAERHELAIAAFKRAIDLSPEFSFAYFNLGLCYLRLGLKGQAEEALRRALELDPNNQEARRLLNQRH